MGINLKVRNLENAIVSALNTYSDVPIEMQRIVLQGILSQITAKADEITQKELLDFQKEQMEKEIKEE